MAKKITTKNELNQAIYDCVSDLLSVGASSKGDKFDETVKDKFVQYLPNARLVETKEWCSIAFFHFHTHFSTSGSKAIDNKRKSP